MISGLQIRAARASLRWTLARLTKESGVSIQTLVRLEQSEGIPPSRSTTLMDIQRAFELAGIEFIGSPDDGPGIRLRSPTQTPSET